MSSTMIVEALQALEPEAQYAVSYDGTVDDIEWLTDGAKPSNADIEAKRVALVAEEPLRLLRVERNTKLAETDWWASSDLTMTQAQTDYRQALRDITDNATSLDDVTWPTKP